jgi:hypothetical protein
MIDKPKQQAFTAHTAAMFRTVISKGSDLTTL